MKYAGKNGNLKWTHQTHAPTDRIPYTQPPYYGIKNSQKLIFEAEEKMTKTDQKQQLFKFALVKYFFQIFRFLQDSL